MAKEKKLKKKKVAAPKTKVVVKDSQQIIDLTGTIISVDENVLVFQHRMRRTSNELKRVIPISDILFCKGKPGEEGVVTFRGTERGEDVDTIFEEFGEYQGTERGFAQFVDDDGTPFMFNTKFDPARYTVQISGAEPIRGEKKEGAGKKVKKKIKAKGDDADSGKKLKKKKKKWKD